MLVISKTDLRDKTQRGGGREKGTQGGILGSQLLGGLKLGYGKALWRGAALIWREGGGSLKRTGKEVSSEHGEVQAPH